jgi:multiple sugar transport system permease protein
MNRVSRRISEGFWFAPAAVLLLLIYVYPILRTLVLSLLHLNLETGFQPRFAGLDNFARLASDSRFHSSLRVTILFTTVSVALEFFLGLLLALAVESIKKGRRTARTLLLIPWTLPTAIIAVLWMWIFNDQYGIINALLLKMGVVASPIAWLGGPRTAMSAVIMADVWKAFPFVMIVLLAGLQSIPHEMYEAIEIDGGSVWHKFRYVTIPYLLPFIFLALIFRIIQAFAVFDLVYVLTGGGPGGATETISVYGYYTYMRYMDFGYGAALVMVIVVVLALIAWVIYSLLLRKYETGR